MQVISGSCEGGEAAIIQFWALDWRAPAAAHGAVLSVSRWMDKIFPSAPGIYPTTPGQVGRSGHAAAVRNGGGW